MEEFVRFLAEKFYYVFLVSMGLYVILRLNRKPSTKKQRPIFFFGLGVFLIYSGAILIMKTMLPSWFMLVLIPVIIAGCAYFIRKHWCFRLTCAACGARLDWNTILIDDRNLCSECLDKLSDTTLG